MIFYIFLYLLLILIPLLLTIYAIYYLVGDFFGAPFVPTQGFVVSSILKKAGLKKGQTFIELGSGDGRVVRQAAKEYGVFAVGVEIHPLLVLYSRLASRIQGIKTVKILAGNFFQINLRDVDVVFMFLLPKTLKKLRPKLLQECRKGTLIISHGFRIPEWESRLKYKIDRKMFPTYFYRA